jgi:hypothetical protein
MNTGNFFAELKRGDVHEVAVANALVSWLLIQIVISTCGRGPSVAGERAYSFVVARDLLAALKVWEATAIPMADPRRQLSARTAICVLAGKELSGPNNS